MHGYPYVFTGIKYMRTYTGIGITFVRISTCAYTYVRIFASHKPQVSAKSSGSLSVSRVESRLNNVAERIFGVSFHQNDDNIHSLSIVKSCGFISNK